MSPAMRGALYGAVWRWHSYAGLLVLPILAWMAATGALYLYKPEIEHRLYRTWIEGPAGQALPLATMTARVEATSGGTVTRILRSAAPGESWRMTIDRPSGPDRLLFVRPESGRVVGESAPGGPLDIVKQLHSLSTAGPVANILVEIAAGWAIVLVLSGFYLWWPRAGSRLLSLAGRAGERRFWRNLHASAGALAGAVILFLALTGMPWTAFWGSQFHGFVAARQIGRPAAPGPATGHHGPALSDAHLPWTLRGNALPVSSDLPSRGPDRALATAEARGLRAPWVLDLPAGGAAPYRFSAAAVRTGDIRVISVDPGSGRVLQDVRFADFGIGARLFEWGIHTHQGEQYGEANRLAMLAGCLGMLMLAVSAPIMWWKRRRPGKDAARPPADARTLRGVAIIMLLVGALFPLTGLTMIAALAWEGLRRPRPARA